MGRQAYSKVVGSKPMPQATEQAAENGDKGGSMVAELMGVIEDMSEMIKHLTDRVSQLEDELEEARK